MKFRHWVYLIIGFPFLLLYNMIVLALVETVKEWNKERKMLEDEEC